MKAVIIILATFSYVAALAGSGDNITIGYGKSGSPGNKSIAGGNIKLQFSVYKTQKMYWLGGVMGSLLEKKSGSLGNTLTYVSGEYYEVYGGIGHHFIRVFKNASLNGAITLGYQYGDEMFGLKPVGWWDAYYESKPKNSIGLGGQLSLNVPIFHRFGACFLIDYRVFSSAFSPQRNFEFGLSYLFGKR